MGPTILMMKAGGNWAAAQVHAEHLGGSSLSPVAQILVQCYYDDPLIEENVVYETHKRFYTALDKFKVLSSETKSKISICFWSS